MNTTGNDDNDYRIFKCRVSDDDRGLSISPFFSDLYVLALMFRT